jgi:hypothetical protein
VVLPLVHPTSFCERIIPMAKCLYGDFVMLVDKRAYEPIGRLPISDPNHAIKKDFNSSRFVISPAIPLDIGFRDICHGIRVL